MKTTIKIAVIAMMGMNLGVNGQDQIKDRLTITNSNNDQVLHLRPNSGNSGFIYWAENGVAERGILGFEKGSRDLVYASGGFNFDNSIERFRIKSNGNFGIGTDNPSSKLDVIGEIKGEGFSVITDNYRSKLTGNMLEFSRYGWSYIDNKDSNGSIAIRTGGQENVDLFVKFNGYLGIGTTSPRAKQHLFTGNSNGIKDLYVTSIIEGMDARLQLMSSNAGSNGSSISLTNESSSWTLHQKTASLGNRFDIGYRVSTESEDIAARQNIYFSILKNGNVGIGTVTTGNHKLAVEGSIGAREIKVEAFPNWSDFVFYEDYELPTLKEVENHIKEKGHLKDIPSAKEVEKNGFYLGEMDAKLLQKIEELTLYTIEQEKKLKNQEDKINALEKQNSKIDKQQKEIDELKALVQKLLKNKN